MGKKIQFKRPPQRCVINFANASLPCGAGIRNNDIDAAELANNGIECALNAVPIRDIAGKPERGAADLLCHALCGRRINVQHGNFGAVCRHGFGRRPPDSRATAGNHRDLARQRLFGRFAQLGLFQRPIFDVKLVFFRDRLIPAHGFGRSHHLNRVLRNIGSDTGVFGGCAKPEQAHARHQNDARITGRALS